MNTSVWHEIDDMAKKHIESLGWTAEPGARSFFKKTPEGIERVFGASMKHLLAKIQNIEKKLQGHEKKPKKVGPGVFGR